VGYLSDIARRRIAALLLLAGIVVAVLAILDVGPFDDPPTPEDRVQETVEEFYAAAADRDFERYCGLLTAGARDQLRANAARLIEEAGRLSCQEILSAAPEETFAGITAKIREVSVSGIRARVEANVRREGVPGLESRTMFLDQEDGVWRVSDPG
jgi:hypothetical protein